MTIPLAVTPDLVAEVELHRFVTEASTLGIPPGTSPPGILPTTFGNGQDFLIIGTTPGGWRYAQLLGCITLTVLND